MCRCALSSLSVFIERFVGVTSVFSAVACMYDAAGFCCFSSVFIVLWCEFRQTCVSCACDRYDSSNVFCLTLSVTLPRLEVLCIAAECRPLVCVRGTRSQKGKFEPICYCFQPSWSMFWPVTVTGAVGFAAVCCSVSVFRLRLHIN